MYIFLDESYNLKDRNKPQFISINGFKTVAIEPIQKQWKVYRRKFVGKERIHATDERFKLLREKSVKLICRPDAVFLTVFQIVQEISIDKYSLYYKNGKLGFDKVYEDMLRALFNELNLQEYKKVVITIDSRKHRGGILGRKKFRENILFYLKGYYPDTIFDFEMQPSCSNILLEVADFISNTFYKKYLGQEIDFLEKLELKTIEIKNPLGKRGDDIS